VDDDPLETTAIDMCFQVFHNWANDEFAKGAWLVNSACELSETDW